MRKNMRNKRTFHYNAKEAREYAKEPPKRYTAEDIKQIKKWMKEA